MAEVAKAILFFLESERKQSDLKEHKENKKEEKNRKEVGKLERKLDDTSSDKDDLLSQDDEDNTEESMGEEKPQVTYSFHKEKFLQEQGYSSATLDYVQLFYGSEKGKSSFSADEEYLTGMVQEELVSETMTTEEAEQMVIEIQYAAVLGTMQSVNHRDRQRFSNWEMINKTELMLFHKLYALTDNVDYSRMF